MAGSSKKVNAGATCWIGHEWTTALVSSQSASALAPLGTPDTSKWLDGVRTDFTEDHVLRLVSSNLFYQKMLQVWVRWQVESNSKAAAGKRRPTENSNFPAPHSDKFDWQDKRKLAKPSVQCLDLMMCVCERSAWGCTCLSV